MPHRAATWKVLTSPTIIEKGGPGSGNFGHGGRPGKQGGSSSKGGPSVLDDLDSFTAAISEKYPLAADKVDGRGILDRNNVPNLASIDAEVGHLVYDELSGIREVPMADFPGITGRTYSVSHNEGVRELQKKIKANNLISPLIVVVDEEGPYILEGSHRIDALYNLGAKSFPAVVVTALDIED